MSIAAITGPTAPKRWVEKVGRSIKGSDTPHLIADLGTLCRNEVRFGAAQRTFTRLTKPSDFQARALELLGVKLGA